MLKRNLWLPFFKSVMEGGRNQQISIWNNERLKEAIGTRPRNNVSSLNSAKQQYLIEPSF